MGRFLKKQERQYFMPYIQSLVLLLAVALIILIIAINKDSRYSHSTKVSLNKSDKVSVNK